MSGGSRWRMTAHGSERTRVSCLSTHCTSSWHFNTNFVKRIYSFIKVRPRYFYSKNKKPRTINIINVVNDFVFLKVELKTRTLLDFLVPSVPRRLIITLFSSGNDCTSLINLSKMMNFVEILIKNPFNNLGPTEKLTVTISGVVGTPDDESSEQ